MENENFKPEESLQLINSMINSARNRLADDGFLFIFWGWLVTFSALLHYICIKLDFEYGHFVWIIAMPFGGIVSAIYGARQNKKKKVKTHLDTYLAYLWIAFGVALLITLGLMPLHGIKVTYCFLMVLYGIATLVSGGLINFKPLIVGSVFAFAAAIASVFVGETEQLLCISIALLGSYIVPGHLLRMRFRSQNV